MPLSCTPNCSRDAAALRAVAALQPPIIWLGQSVRTTLVLPNHFALAGAPVMASLGDAIHRPRLLTSVFSGGLHDRLKTRSPVLLDSGGFTALSRPNANLDIEKLIDVYAATDAELMISLDTPPTLRCGPRDRARRYSVTLGNLDALVAALGPRRVVPVIHGRTLREVLSNARATREITPIPLMVCLGGIVPLLRRCGGVDAVPSDDMIFIAEAITAIRETFPRSLLHVLGAGAPRTVLAALALGADSVDSIAWRIAAGFGTVFTPANGERFVETRTRRRATSRPFLSAKDIGPCQCPICAELTVRERFAALARNYRARAAHNAWVLLQEAAAFHSAKSARTLAAHIEKRLPLSWITAWRRTPVCSSEGLA